MSTVIRAAYNPLLPLLFVFGLLALLLALGCSLRIGGILRLTWEHVELSEESRAKGTACVLIERELKRCDQSSLENLEKRGRSKVRFVFPDVKRKTPCKAVSVLKASKTAISIPCQPFDQQVFSWA